MAIKIIFYDIISIAIADFEIVKDSPKYHHKFQLNEIETGILFTDVIEIHSLELQKIPKSSDNTAKYDWLQFLKAEKEEEFDMLAERSPALKQAVVELKRLSKDEEAQRLYEAREKAIRDENSRMKTAVNKERANRNMKLIEKMLKRGEKTNDIVDFLEISVEEVENTKKKLSL